MWKFQMDEHPCTMQHKTTEKRFVELLLEKGADPNVEGTDGRTPLYYAAHHIPAKMSQTRSS